LGSPPYDFRVRSKLCQSLIGARDIQQQTLVFRARHLLGLSKRFLCAFSPILCIMKGVGQRELLQAVNDCIINEGAWMLVPSASKLDLMLIAFITRIRRQWPQIVLFRNMRRDGATGHQSNFRSLGRPVSLRDRKEVSLASRTSAAAIKLSTLFNRKRHVVDVAFNTR
jgi:hypothetical protein